MTPKSMHKVTVDGVTIAGQACGLGNMFELTVYKDGNFVMTTILSSNISDNQNRKAANSIMDCASIYCDDSSWVVDAIQDILQYGGTVGQAFYPVVFADTLFS